MFGGIRIVGARPEAAPRLAAAGVPPTAMALLGPAVAMADGPDRPARVDEAEWEVTADGEGRLHVTALQERATPFVTAPTATWGRISGPGELHLEGKP